VLNVGAKEDPTPEEIRMAYDSTDVLLTDLPTTKLAPALKIGIPLLQQVMLPRWPSRASRLLCAPADAPTLGSLVPWLTRRRLRTL
jgi:hypothetical protein